MSHLTQEEVIKRHLGIVGCWVPSYDLNKIELCGTWIGDRGSRTARTLAEGSQIQRELGKDLLRSGIETDYKDRPIVAKYCYYHTLKPLKRVDLWRTNPISGEKELLKTIYE